MKTDRPILRQQLVRMFLRLELTVILKELDP